MLPRILLQTDYKRPAPDLAKLRKLFKWRDDGDLDLHFDWSSLECFLSCNRSALYKLVHSKTSKGKAALTFGAAIHAALEVYYKLHTEPDKSKVLQLCRQAIDNSFAEMTISYFDEYRTPDYAYSCFLQYIQHYAHESLTPVVTDDRPLIEFSFAFDLAEMNIPASVFHTYGLGMLTNEPEKEAQAVGDLKVHVKWTGICDLVANINGENWLIDHKTTSILSSDFFDGFNLAMQPIGYVYAANLAFPELAIAGFMVNTLACRKPTKTGKGFEPHRSFHRYEPWQFDEWKSDAINLISEFVYNLTLNSWPKKTTWCIGKYGKCPFLDVCSLPPAHRIHLLDSDQYVNNTWKPVSA